MAQITLNSSGVASSGSLLLQTNGTTTQATVDTSGNLGLGVTPSAWGSTYSALQLGASAGIFTLKSSLGSTYYMQNSYFNGSSYIYTNTGAASYFQTASDASFTWRQAASGTAGNAITFTQAMTLDASGRLGLGVTSPSLSFEVGINAAKGYMHSGVGVFSVGTSTNHPYGFDINGTERARIDSSGNLLVGTTSQISASDRLEVVGTNGIGIKSTGNAGNACILAWHSATSGDNLFIPFYTESSITQRGSIDYNRGAGLVRYNTTSDATLKNIIGDADGAKSVQILNSTRIREYSWKDDETNKPQIGVIAQELHETFTGAVSVGGDKVSVDEEGNETTQYIPWAVDKTAFTFHLVAGWQAHEKIIQEQQAIITQLQADVAALKG